MFKLNAVYQQVNNIAPDLMVYFGDLHWRAVGSLGHGKHWTLDNDTDLTTRTTRFRACSSCTSCTGRRGARRGASTDGHRADPADRFGLPIPGEMQGRVI
ncbi:MAG: hypothetical protein U0521_11970 [Anaerolineae bacterium]